MSPLLDITPPPWMEHALCGPNNTNLNPDLWFPTPGGTARPAQTICATCPVKTDCLTYATELEGNNQHRGRSGIYGGLTPKQRANAARQRRAS